MCCVQVLQWDEGQDSRPGETEKTDAADKSSLERYVLLGTISPFERRSSIHVLCFTTKVAMGGNRRRRRHKAGNAPRGGVDDDVTKARDDGGTTMLVRIESSTPDNDGDCDGDNDDHPPAWSVDYVMNVERRNPPPSKSNVDISYADSDADAMMSSITDIGLLIIRGTLDKITRRNSKRSRKKGKDAVTGGHSSSDDNITNEAKPTPVQLRLWPALLDSLDESKSPRGRGGGGVSAGPLNVVGIAPTGTGKLRETTRDETRESPLAFANRHV
jgi:hypothetical protein